MHKARVLVACCSLAITSLVSAQDYGETRIQRALEELRTQPVLQLRLDGSETVGLTQSDFTIYLTWATWVLGQREIAKVEVLEWHDGILTDRIVGDGQTFWAYDVERNEYSATTYGSPRGQQPPEYRHKLLASLNSVAKGQVTHATRLLKEIYGDYESGYRSWMPGIPSQVSGNYIFYENGSPVRRQITFMSNPAGSHEALSWISYYDDASVQDRTRIVKWKMTVDGFRDVPSWTSFVFQPPEGARPITTPNPAKN